MSEQKKSSSCWIIAVILIFLFFVLLMAACFIVGIYFYLKTDNYPQTNQNQVQYFDSYTAANTFQVIEKINLENYGQIGADATNVRLWLALIPSIDPYQRVVSRTITPANYRLITDSEGNEYAEFSIGNMQAMDSVYIEAVYEVEVAGYADNLGSCEGAGIYSYQDPETYINSDEPAIIDLAEQLSRGKNNDCDKVRAFYEYVNDNMIYEYSGYDNGALQALDTKIGDCTDYSDLFLALARAAGISGRFFTGVVYLEDQSDYTQMLHNWTEVYFPGTGWSQVDLTYGQPLESRDYYFAQTDGMHIIVTRGRLPEHLQGYSYFYYNYDNEQAVLDSTEDWDIALITN